MHFLKSPNREFVANVATHTVRNILIIILRGHRGGEEPLEE